LIEKGKQLSGQKDFLSLSNSTGNPTRAQRKLSASGLGEKKMSAMVGEDVIAERDEDEEYLDDGNSGSDFANLPDSQKD
jgi:hypothetical protein